MRRLVFILLTVICLIISPLASTLPDGLETVLHQQHLSEQVEESSWAIMVDYSVGFVQNPVAQSWIAGLIGLLIVGLLCLGLSALVRRKLVFGK